MLIKAIHQHVGVSRAPTIIILGTGPSLPQGIEYITNNGEYDLVISLKQSYEYLPTDTKKVVHLFNPYNLKKYEYLKKVTRIYYDDVFAKFQLSKGFFDFRFLVSYQQNDDLTESVLYNKNFSEFEYEQPLNELRPIMPGIFPEALYLSLTFHPKKILLFGIDYNRVNDIGNTHVYDTPSIITQALKLVSKPKVMKKVFYRLGLRTEFSHASTLEQQVAIPGITKFIRYIETKKNCKVIGWQHGL